MNRYDRYSKINWDVPVYVPDFSKVNSLVEEQGKTYQGIQDKYDAVTNAAKTAAAKVKYIDDPDVQDAAIYRQWLAGIQQQQLDIAKAYEQDYKLGMTKLKEFQNNLHTDLTAGQGYKLNERKLFYDNVKKEAQEQLGKNGLYEGQPAYVNYFMSGAGKKGWLKDFPTSNTAGLNITNPQYQANWTAQDQSNLVKEMQNLAPTKENLLEAASDDPEAVREINNFVQSYKIVNGTVPFHRLMVNATLSQKTKAKLMDYALALMEPRAKDVNFTYEVEQGKSNVFNREAATVNPDGSLSNPNAFYVEVPEYDKNGDPVVENGVPKTQRVLNTLTNPLVQNLTKLSEDLATRDTEFSTQLVKDEISFANWESARKREEELRNKPIVTTTVELKDPEGVSVDQVRDNHNNLRAALANQNIVVPKGKEIEALQQKIREAKTPQEKAQYEYYIDEFQRGYALISQFEALGNTPDYTTYRDSILSIDPDATYGKTPDGHVIKYDPNRKEFYAVLGNQRLYESQAPKGYAVQSKPSSTVSDSKYGMQINTPESTPSKGNVVETSIFDAAYKKTAHIGDEYNRKLMAGQEKYNATHRPKAQFVSTTPLEMNTGRQLTKAEEKTYKETIANGINVSSLKNVYSITTTEGEDGEILPFTIPAGANDVKIVDPERIEFSYDAMSSYMHGAEFAILADVAYTIPDPADSKKRITVQSSVIIPQKTHDYSTGRATNNFTLVDQDSPRPFFEADAYANSSPAIKAKQRLVTFKDYTSGSQPVILGTHYGDNSTVTKSGGKYYLTNQYGIKTEIGEDVARTSLTNFYQANSLSQAGADPRTTKFVTQ